MRVDEFLSGLPPEFAARSDDPVHLYELRRDRVAVRGEAPAGLRARVEHRFEAEGICVLRIETGDSEPLDATATLPVYSLGPGGAPAVFTGRILVRFAEGVVAGERADAIHEAGFEIEEILSYAPHASWVRSRTGDAADALGKLERLTVLPDVENVEPQMLSPAARR